MQTYLLLVILGIVFGSLGAVMAYLITYKEWQHHYPDKERPRRMAFEAAVITLAFFMAVALLVGWFF